MTSEDKVILKEFFKFLKENNIFLSYRTNLHLMPFHNQDFFTVQIKKIGGYENLLTSAFCWMSTKQGDAYWRYLDTKWRFYLNLDLKYKKE